MMQKINGGLASDCRPLRARVCHPGAVFFALVFALVWVHAFVWTHVRSASAQELTIASVGNAGVVLSDVQTTLLVDLPHVPGAHGYAHYEPEALQPRGDVVSVITHTHADHFDPDRLSLEPEWRVIGPPTVAEAVGSDRVLEGDSLSVGAFTIVAIATAHAPGHRSYRIGWHGRRIYVTGDTEDETSVPTSRLDVLFLTPWLACGLADSDRRPGAVHVVVYHRRPGVSDSSCGIGAPASREVLLLRPNEHRPELRTGSLPNARGEMAWFRTPSARSVPATSAEQRSSGLPASWSTRPSATSGQAREVGVEGAKVSCGDVGHFCCFGERQVDGASEIQG